MIEAGMSDAEVAAYVERTERFIEHVRDLIDATPVGSPCAERRRVLERIAARADRARTGGRPILWTAKGGPMLARNTRGRPVQKLQVMKGFIDVGNAMVYCFIS